MFTKIVLAVSLTVSALPALAQGSMAPEVSIIFVEPPPEIRKMDEYRAIKKSQKLYEKAAAKSRMEDQKAANKRALEADKAYYKRLENDRKVRRKK